MTVVHGPSYMDHRTWTSDRTIFLTQEKGNQLSSWLSYMYSRWRIRYSENGKIVTQYRTPSMKDSDRVYPRLNDQVVILILLAFMSSSAHLLQKTLDH